MRLIDADELLQKLESSKIQPTKDTDEFIDGWCEGFNTVVDMIRNQPTAYDVEKVVAELKKQKSDLTDWAEDKAFEIGIERAIEVVRKGGVA